MKKRLLIVVVLAAGAAAIVYWKCLGEPESNAIRLSGNIELTEVDIAFKTAGRLVELGADEGATVKKGAVLARLDSEELGRALEREQAGITASESALEQLRAAIEFQRAAIASEISMREAEAAQASARLEELTSGSRLEEVAQARAAVDEARAMAIQAESDYQRAERLIANDDISRQNYIQLKTRHEAAAAALKRAMEAFKLVDIGPRKEQIAQAQAALNRARAALSLAQAGKLDLARREKEISMRGAEIQRAKAQSSVVEAQLNDRAIASPVDGVVLSKSAEPGEVLAGGAAVMTVGDIDRPWVRGYVSETQLGRVKLGMPADVTTDSFPGKVYRGRVAFISAEAEFTPKQIQTSEERVKLVYRVKIEVENPNRELKSNMPVDAVLRIQ